MIYTFDEGITLSKHQKALQYTLNAKGCWVCVSHKPNVRTGYVYINRNKKRNTALHRYSYILANGHIPKDMLIRHACNTKKCFNPDHLDYGTPAENSKDMTDQGRQVQGEKHHAAKLTAELVKQIIPDPRPQKVIAKEYNISQPTVCFVKARKIWKGVEV